MHIFLNCTLFTSVADPGCLSRIPDPTFLVIPDPGSGSRILHGWDPGSGKNSSRIPDPWGKKAPDPGSRIRNTAIYDKERERNRSNTDKYHHKVQFLLIFHIQNFFKNFETVRNMD
jgi:hypothetical protein